MLIQHAKKEHFDPKDNNAKEELLNPMEPSYLNDPLDRTMASKTLHLSEDFLLSNYEDDDDDSGFCCPCCLPR